ncbi:52 kDa repressor of the inhibitor of the protein kinase-like [Ostrinia furnacalis]|uniref:52 kDa repressor of the inhibitor of the protein kinase-like n=1 Tax=Ostrinia furnacalis TaxID=93504 RepID=UPI00103F75F3|nr:52 kDa repressor of the inhibitor of the protein kinase-like [Ostrinia furnacalis]
MKKKRNTNNCCAENCRNRQKDTMDSFFTLPTDPERRSEWLKQIGRLDLLNKPSLKSKSYKVCSLHFDRSAMREVITRKLLPDAVPTKLLPNQPQSCIPNEKESCRVCDASTQTEESHVNTLCVVKVESLEVEVDQEAQAASASGMPQKRKLPTEQTSGKKLREKIQFEPDEIKTENETDTDSDTA